MENQAEYQISSSVNEDILEIVVKGAVTESTFEEVVNDVNIIIKANNLNKTLADFRAINKRIDPSEMYRYFRRYNILLFDMKYAIVDLPENIQYKTAAINAGLKSLMWFTDMDEARLWLKKQKI